MKCTEVLSPNTGARRRALLRAVAICCTALLSDCSSVDSGAPSEVLSHGRFASVRVYRPAGAVRRVALLLSGDGGWSRDLGAIAYKLSGEGTLTAGIDLPPLFTNLARDPASCVSPYADLADLARYLQDRYHLPHTPPLLIGHSAGATLAYTSIAQAPAGTFSGALTLSFCVELELQKPLCKAPALRYRPLPSGSVRLLPGTTPAAPWTDLHGLEDPICTPLEALGFLAAIRGAHLVPLPHVTHNYGHADRWWPQFSAAEKSITEPQAAATR